MTTTSKLTYLFTDIEADGPVPGLYSMISFASVACSEEGEALGEFERNLLPLPSASQHPSTMEDIWTPKNFNFVTMLSDLISSS